MTTSDLRQYIAQCRIPNFGNYVTAQHVVDELSRDTRQRVYAVLQPLAGILAQTIRPHDPKCKLLSAIRMTLTATIRAMERAEV